MSPEQLKGVIESLLFASERPLSLASIKQALQDSQATSEDIRSALTELAQDFASDSRGVSLEEVGAGYQLRTKAAHLPFLKNTLKSRPFKLSGPALETLAIVAYKQPVIKSDVDEIRGVESGHLLRALIEKGLVNFGGKSDAPGKPMQYQTTRQFLEIFGLRNLQELPSLAEIDELLPEGIEPDDKTAKKAGLDELTTDLAQNVDAHYSAGEEELMHIASALGEIEVSTPFFDEEKRRERERQDAARAESLRQAILQGEALESKDQRWLEKYES